MSPRVNASPPMLDATSVGVEVLNELATECGVPVPPISASKPIDMMTGARRFEGTGIRAAISRFPNSCLLPFASRINISMEARADFDAKA